MKQLYKLGLRRCYKCKQIKLIERFATCRALSFGHSYLCKKCDSTKTKEAYLKIKNDPILFAKYREKHIGHWQKYGKPKHLALRFLLLKKYNFSCYYCGRKPPEVVLEIEHVFPRSKGGKNEISNYVTACRECNKGKYDHLL